MRKHGIIAAGTFALALGGAVLAAPAAQAVPVSTAAASTASLRPVDGELWYKAGAGQANRLTVSAWVDDSRPDDPYYVITFRDRVDITLASDQCRYPSAADHKVAECRVGAPLGSDDSDIYDVDLGDGDDTATIDPHNSAYASVYGGDGNDVLRGSDSAVFYGGNGNDRLVGGGGVWDLGPYGGPGNDTITGCATDCYGGPGNDSLTGTDETNNLYGEDGNDTLHGKGDADSLYGGKGNDRLYGDQGNDTLFGNSGNDALYGGTGTDKLSGGPGTDKVHQN